MQRRSFLGFLAGAANAAPHVAKSALTTAGIPTEGSGQLSVSDVIGPPPAPRKSTVSAIRAAIAKIGGLPDWKIKQIQLDTRYVQSVDADIGSLQSVSATSKVRMQRSRNYQRGIAQALDFSNEEISEGREKFEADHKVWWY